MKINITAATDFLKPAFNGYITAIYLSIAMNVKVKTLIFTDKSFTKGAIGHIISATTHLCNKAA
jgi:hypothetical protein